MASSELKHRAPSTMTEGKDSAGEENFTEKDVASSTSLQGDVYEDVRKIDLDEFGNKRPIKTDIDIATRLISLEDDPTLPCFTFRMWFLGLGLACFGAYFRPQTVTVSQLFLQIIAYILGRVLEEILPGPRSVRFKTADNAFWRFVNPGKFNIKEHVAITIFASIAADSAQAINIFASDDLFYGIQPNAAVGIFTIIEIQGHSYWGMDLQLFDALHRGKGIMMQKKRVQIFWTLTGISIFCLAKRDSTWVTRIFGGAAGNEGLGILSICLDWNYLASGGYSMGSLFTPLSTQLSLYVGVAVCMISFSVAFARNTWNGQNFPFLSQQLFYENGTEYDQLTILDERFNLDPAKLAVQGLPWFASSQVIGRIAVNLSVGVTFTHVLLWYGKDILDVINKYRRGENYDPHFEKMKVYAEVPMWWYAAMLIGCFGMAMGTIYTSNSGLPWWGLIVALIISAILMPFVVTVAGVIGFVPYMEPLVQMLGAVIIPGAIPETSSASHLHRADSRVHCHVILNSDTCLKVHVGVPAGQSGEKRPQVRNSDPGGPLQQVQGFNASAITWGALGNVLYRPGGRYACWPKIGANKVITPVLCFGTGYLVVGINSSVLTMFSIALSSQLYLRRHQPRWFRKYNFLLSAALDGGTQVMVFVFTFALAGGSGKATEMPHWALHCDLGTIESGSDNAWAEVYSDYSAAQASVGPSGVYSHAPKSEARLSSIRLSNAETISRMPGTLVAVFVGGTSGIGQGMAEAFARWRGGRAHIVIVGRNKDAAADILAHLPKPSRDEELASTNWTHEFIPCDVSLMSKVHAASQLIASKYSKVNFLILSAGFLSTTGRDETSEGLDKKLALHYYSRWKFICELEPGLRKAKDEGEEARVLSILAAGKGARLDLEDLGLEKRYSAARSADDKARAGQMLSPFTWGLGKKLSRRPLLLTPLKGSAILKENKRELGDFLGVLSLEGHPRATPPHSRLQTLPSAPPVLDDPFGGNGAPNQNQAPVMVTVNDGGRHLQLTQGIAGRLAGEGTPPVPNAIPQQPNPMAYPNLPAALRAQMEALQPPAPQPQRKCAPANPPPPPAPLASYQGGILVLQQGAPPRATRGRPRTLPVAPPPLPLPPPPPL
ncbi:OPT oligopeptide transporter protein-domain-containing protein [Ephemerocybe angulata]|uniref:OPT oligopeptide transporter protein-domain-containing protein n=1 Tax=Ephemerocybe angulata TaxID=980116 RepID=A0A8H6IJF9_9AGAR|nr:OPT oligopeptide transporter protein-domain-containing protein [Tulosesus angulatus]